MSAAVDLGLRRRVLVVDDDPEIVTFLATLLELEGIESTVATSAAAALEKLEHGVPNLVLLDIAMPDRDGLDLYRADPRAPQRLKSIHRAHQFARCASQPDFISTG